MISGHCFEAAMGGLSAFHRAQDLGCGSRVLDTLAQHAIDVGDRRVLAGVHYPSDNISSWIVALLIAPKACRDDQAAGWLWRAISERSVVYKAIKDAVMAARHACTSSASPS